MITHVVETGAVRDCMRSGKKLYGSDVGERIVEFLKLRDDDRAFDWTHERLRFESGSDSEFEYL